MSIYRSLILSSGLISAVLLGNVANAQTYEIDGEQLTVEQEKISLQDVQARMDPIRLVDAYLIDKAAPRNARGGWGERASNVFDAGEQIDAVVYLANVGKYNPGEPDNQHDLEVYINIHSRDGTLIEQIRPVHTYQNVLTGDPLQADYFRERFTVSARVTQAGRYDVSFVFIDNTRPKDKQIALEAPLDVIIENAQASQDLTGLVELMMAEDADQSYLLRRCAAYFRSQIELVGKDSFSEENFNEIDAKVRYFLNADIIINTGLDGVPEQQAKEETLAVMKDISFSYMVRMKRNYDAGQHPWSDDVMLQRDEGACTTVYDTRE